MEQPQPREDVEEAEKAVMSSELNVIGALKGLLILGMLRGGHAPNYSAIPIPHSRNLIPTYWY